MFWIAIVFLGVMLWKLNSPVGTGTNQDRPGDWTLILLNAAPLLLLVGVFIFMMRQIQRRKTLFASVAPSVARTGIGYDLAPARARP